MKKNSGRQNSVLDRDEGQKVSVFVGFCEDLLSYPRHPFRIVLLIIKPSFGLGMIVG
jgi:hypothetical protein